MVARGTRESAGRRIFPVVAQRGSAGRALAARIEGSFVEEGLRGLLDLVRGGVGRHGGCGGVESVRMLSGWMRLRFFATVGNGEWEYRREKRMGGIWCSRGEGLVRVIVIGFVADAC